MNYQETRQERDQGEWEIWSSVSGRKPEKQIAASNYSYSEALSEAKQYCAELRKIQTTEKK